MWEMEGPLMGGRPSAQSVAQLQVAFGTKYLLPIKYQVILQPPISIRSWTDLRVTMDASLG